MFVLLDERRHRVTLATAFIIVVQFIDHDRSSLNRFLYLNEGVARGSILVCET